MSTIDNNPEMLQQKFELLSRKYDNALNQDLEFDELKKIYIELKEIRTKLEVLKSNS